MLLPLPPFTPITTPVALTVATVVGLMAHVPDGVALLNVVVWPTHVVSPPLMADGRGFTDTSLVLMQPVPSVYVIVAVPGSVPVADTPVTVAVPGPVPLTMAMPGALLLQVPPDGVPVSVVVPPASHTCGTPVIAPGSANTVTVAVLRHPEPFV